MITKHTPGPWAFAKYSKKRFGLGQRGDGAFFLLQCINDDTDNPAARADARLIAAAPDLLEMLVEAAKFIQPYIIGQELLERIDATIRKATSNE